VNEYRMRELRKEKLLTQEQLAIAASMAPATLNRLEMGKRSPNLKTLERLANALGVEIADFFLTSPSDAKHGPPPQISTQVKRARKQALLTQGELAARAGIGVATVNRIEMDRLEPHFHTIRKIAKALGVDAAILISKDRLPAKSRGGAT